MAKQPNFRKALAQMLEYIFKHSLTINDTSFIISTDVMLKNPLIVQTLEEAGCIQRLGRLNLRTQAKYNRAYPGFFARQLHDMATGKFPKMKSAWGHWVWVINITRYDQMNPQLLLSRPLLKKVESQYGKDPQIRAVDEGEGPTDDESWRATP